MFMFVLLLHGFLCLFLILLVLVQQGKGADAGALMGSGAESIIGAGRAGTFLTRLTTGMAIAFMCTSIILVKMYAAGGAAPRNVNVLEGSVVGTAPKSETAPAEEKASEAAPEKPEAASSAPAEAPEAQGAAPQAPQLPQQ